MEGGEKNHLLNVSSETETLPETSKSQIGAVSAGPTSASAPVSTSHAAPLVSTSHAAPLVSTSHAAPGVSTSHAAPGVTTSHTAPGVSTSQAAPSDSTSHAALGVSTSHAQPGIRPPKRGMQQRPLTAKRTRVQGFERSVEEEYQVPTSRCDQDDESVIVIDSEEDDNRCTGTMYSYRVGEEDEDIEDEQEVDEGISENTAFREFARETLAKIETNEKENLRKVSEELGALKVEKSKLKEQYSLVARQQNNVNRKIEEIKKVHEELQVLKDGLSRLTEVFAKIEADTATDTNARLAEEINNREGVTTSHTAPGVSTSQAAPSDSTSHAALGVSTSHAQPGIRPPKRGMQQRPLTAKRTRVQGFERSVEEEYQVPTSRCDQDDESVIVIDSEEDDNRCTGTMYSYREGEEDEDIEDEQEVEGGEEEEEAESSSSEEEAEAESSSSEEEAEAESSSTRQESPVAGGAGEGEGSELGDSGAGAAHEPDSEPAPAHQQIEVISSGSEPSSTLSLGSSGADDNED